MISFSTIDPVEARRRLQHPHYSWLPKHAHDEVIRQVERKACRVQCTVMYPSPELEILDEVAAKAITAAIGDMSGIVGNRIGDAIPADVNELATEQEAERD